MSEDSKRFVWFGIGAIAGAAAALSLSRGQPAAPASASPAPHGRLSAQAGFSSAYVPGAVLPHTTDADEVAAIGACRTAQFLLKINHEESARYIGEPAFSSRTRYLAKHPTQILAFTCMDGRLDVSIKVGLPPGIITSFRNIAGRFDLGWPLLLEVVAAQVESATKRGQQTIVLCAYHFSKGDKMRGCAGNGFDLCKSKAVAQRLVRQFSEMFGGSGDSAALPILMGMETDEDALIFHPDSDADRAVDMSAYASGTPNEASIAAAFREAFPNLLSPVAEDLLPLLVGNARHVYNVRATHRKVIAMNHNEPVIGVGRGFGWLHVPNKALIIEPYEQDWGRTCATAATIVLDNIRCNRIDPADGVVVLASTLSFEPQGTYGWKLSEESALYLGRTAAEAIAAAVPELLTATRVHIMPGVVDGHTLRFWPVQQRE